MESCHASGRCLGAGPITGCLGWLPAIALIDIYSPRRLKYASEDVRGGTRHESHLSSWRPKQKDSRRNSSRFPRVYSSLHSLSALGQLLSGAHEVDQCGPLLLAWNPTYSHMDLLTVLPLITVRPGDVFRVFQRWEQPYLQVPLPQPRRYSQGQEGFPRSRGPYPTVIRNQF